MALIATTNTQPTMHQHTSGAPHAVSSHWEVARRLDEASWPGDLVMAGRPARHTSSRIEAYRPPPVVLTAWGIKDMPRKVPVV